MSGEAATPYMLLWDDDFVKLLKYLGISLEIFKRNVDDITIIFEAINRGPSYSVTEKKMAYCEITQQYLQQTQILRDWHNLQQMSQNLQRSRSRSR